MGAAVDDSILFKRSSIAVEWSPVPPKWNREGKLALADSNHLLVATRERSEKMEFCRTAEIADPGFSESACSFTLNIAFSIFQCRQAARRQNHTMTGTSSSQPSHPNPFPLHRNPMPYQVFHLPAIPTAGDIKDRCKHPQKRFPTCSIVPLIK